MTFKGRGLYAYSSKEPRTRRFGWLCIGAFVAVAALLVAGVNVVGHVASTAEERTDTFAEAERVELHSFAPGTVHLTGTDSDEVTVDRTMTGNPMYSPTDSAEVDDGTLRIGAACDGELFFGGIGNCSVDYRIGVPDGTAVTMKGETATMEVWSVTGGAPISVSARSGDVRVVDVAAEVSASVTSGEIALDNVEGDMDLEATSGEIRASGAGENVRAVTSSGAITLTDVDATSLETDSTSGSADISGTFDTADLEVTSGSLNLRTTEEFRLIEARSTSGAIDLGVPQGGYEVTGDSTSGDRDIGVDRDSDGPRIDASTTSGSLNVTSTD